MFGSGKTLSGNTPDLHGSASVYPFPECFPALIREKTTHCFEESPDSLPDSLFGIISELKIATFSTNREAKLRLDQPYLLIREKTPDLTNCRAGIALCPWVYYEGDFSEYWADRIFPKKLLEMFVKKGMKIFSYVLVKEIFLFESGRSRMADLSMVGLSGKNYRI